MADDIYGLLILNRGLFFVMYLYNKTQFPKHVWRILGHIQEKDKSSLDTHPRLRHIQNPCITVEGQMFCSVLFCENKKTKPILSNHVQMGKEAAKEESTALNKMLSIQYHTFPWEQNLQEQKPTRRLQLHLLFQSIKKVWITAPIWKAFPTCSQGIEVHVNAGNYLSSKSNCTTVWFNQRIIVNWFIFFTFINLFLLKCRPEQHTAQLKLMKKIA